MTAGLARRHSVTRWRAASVAACALLALLGLGGTPLTGLLVSIGGPLLCVVAAAGAVAGTLARGHAPILPAALVAWTAGVLTAGATSLLTGGLPFPGPADAFFVLGYALLAVAVARAVHEGAGSWLEAAISALAAAAVGWALLDLLVDVTGTATTVLMTNVAYVAADLLLLGGLTAAGPVRAGGQRPDRGLLLAAVAVLAVADAAFLVRAADGAVALGAPTDALYPLALLLVAHAQWATPRACAAQADAPSVPAVPLVGCALALAVLILDHAHRLPLGVLALAGATLLLGLVRTAVAFRTAVGLHARAAQALTDDLTGLLNRRALLGDLEAACAAGAPATLALFDLDGFKHYNDAYGHPAGDSLLAVLGARLAGAVGDGGRAYRLGGDEFCVLVHGDAPGHALAVPAALAALHEEGPGRAVGCSHGVVALPAEATDPAAALQLADARLYGCKDTRRSSTRAHGRDLLLNVLHEQQPDLEEHSGDVGHLVAAVGRRLGLDAEQVEHAQHAAELHDVGKVAIPEAVLRKPGPLDEDEWALMRRHTIIGERILAAVPALAPVARLVRSSHERWDGGGYPDGLRGEETPLGARIISVCDTFHAITTDRAYRAGRSPEEALAELERCAGSQFDPAVVRAFAAEHAETQGSVPSFSPALSGLAAVAGRAADELAGLAKLRALLGLSALARGGAEVDDLLQATCKTISATLGFRTVALNVLVPERDELRVTAVIGDAGVRAALEGTVSPASAWQRLLAPAHARRGAYFVIAEAWPSEVPIHVPDRETDDDPDSWNPDDALLVPLTAADGTLLGVVSVDEPVWGRRPTDDELDLLVAVVGHAALALDSARLARMAVRRHRVEEHLLRLAAELAAAATPQAIAATVARAVRDGLGFGHVDVELAGEDGPAAARALLEREEGRPGAAVLLDGRAAAQARVRRGFAPVEPSAEGAAGRAWGEHLLGVPVGTADGALLAVIWADAPRSGLLPTPDVLRGVRAVALQAATALAWAARAPMPAPRAASDALV